MKLILKYYFRFIFKAEPVKYPRKAGAVALLFMGFFLCACSREPVDISQSELIRVGSSRITVGEFRQIAEMSQDYYREENGSDSVGDEPKPLRLLDQITEEMILKERAKAIGIEISEAEVDRAVQDIKNDYPEGTFEQVLLENAVSFTFWRERLKARLLIDKVVEKELENNVVITPEEIAAFYNEHYADISEREPTEDPINQGKDINEVIVKRLRKQKAEESYKQWIKELQQTYPAQVDWEMWKKMTASS